MNFKKMIAVMSTIAVASSLFMGCGGGSSNSASSGDTGKIDSEQYLNDFLGAEPGTLDPSKCADSYGNGILQDILEPLTRLEDDKDGKSILKEAGAEKWESNKEGTVWTFKIRENKWSDGQPVKAQDYEYGIKRSLSPNTGSPSAYLLEPIKNAVPVSEGKMKVDELGVKAVDDKTLEITLSEPTPYFLSLTYQSSMLPQRKDIVEKHGEKYGSEKDTLVFNGPFVLSEWTHNSKVVLTKNDFYWDKDSVKLQTINYPVMNDLNAIHNSLENNSIDSAGVITPEWRDRFAKNDKLENIKIINQRVNYAFYNHKDTIFKNTNIRQAFSLGMDREEIANTIFNGINEPAYGWVTRSITGDGENEYRSIVPEPLKEIKEKNSDAKALLLKGMEELNLGSDPSTLKVKFSLGGTDQWMRTFGEYLQQMYKKTLGVNLEIEFLEWPIFQSKVQKGDFQIGYMSWGAEFNDPIAMLRLVTSDSTAILTGWKNDKYDDLIKQASKEMDAKKRLELYKEAEQIIFDDAVVCPVVYTASNIFRYKYVKGTSNNPFSTAGSKHVYTQGRK